MNKKWIKRAGLAGVAMFSAIMLAGCGGGSNQASNDHAANQEVNQTGMPIVNEQITMTMMAPGTGIAQWDTMPTMTYLAEKTGINFNFITPPMADFGTTLNLAFASGDLPDIIFGAGSSNLSRTMEMEFGSQGLLLPLEDLIEQYAPNLHAILEANPDIRKNITSTDGHIYSLPTISKNINSIWPSGPMWYNGEWMEKLNAEVPTTLDEFYDLMIRFRDEEPAGPGVQVWPISNGAAMQWSRQFFLSPFNMTTMGVEAIDGKVQHNATTDNFRAYLEFMHKLYEERILHPEIFTMSSEAHGALVRNNQVGLFQDWFPFFSTGQSEQESMNNPMWHPLTSQWSEKAVIPGSPEMGTGAFALSSANPNPAAAMRWVDELYSEEGALLFNQGPEGYLWENKTHADGSEVRVMTDWIKENGAGQDDPRALVTPDFGITVPAIVLDRPVVLEDINNPNENLFNEWIASETKKNFAPFARVPFPLAALTVEEGDRVTIIQSDLNSFLIESEARFITGAQPINDETWAAFQTTIENMGAKEMAEIMQGVYDRWAAN